jgi:hypothetical protein
MRQAHSFGKTNRAAKNSRPKKIVSFILYLVFTILILSAVFLEINPDIMIFSIEKLVLVLLAVIFVCLAGVLRNSALTEPVLKRQTIQTTMWVLFII